MIQHVVHNTITSGINTEQQHRHSSSSTKASVELRGPVLLTCAMTNIMLLDKYTHEDQSPIRPDAGEPFSGEDEHDDSITDNAGSRSHQFVVFLQAHEGDCSISAPKSM